MTELPSVQRLQHYLDRERLSVNQATVRWGIGAGHLARILRGERTLTRDLVLRLAEPLQLSTAELLEWLQEELLDWLYQAGYWAPSVREEPTYLPRGVLTYDQAEEARWLHDHEYWSYAKIAPLFQVHESTVRRAVERLRQPPGEWRECEWCQARFQGRAGQKFCSDRCCRKRTDQRFHERHREQINQRQRDRRAMARNLRPRGEGS